VDDEADVHLAAYDAAERAFDDMPETVLQPVAGVGVGDADDEGAVFVGDDAGVADPGVEGGWGHGEF